MNEGQADMWAFTITDNASLGDYVVNAKGFRQLFRDNGRDPDSIAYIRSARSTLKYSDYGTFGPNAEVEEHRDGEIYMSTMWDIREMMNRVYPQDTTFKRPLAKTVCRRSRSRVVPTSSNETSSGRCTFSALRRRTRW